MRGVFYLLLALIMVGTAYGACPEGFVLEQNELGQNCRNPACDMGTNLIGVIPDAALPFVMVDFVGMPRPRVGGWSVGPFQCPPDPLNIHPNPDWPCGTDYCPGSPKNVRVANASPE